MPKFEPLWWNILIFNPFGGLKVCFLERNIFFTNDHYIQQCINFEGLPHTCQEGWFNLKKMKQDFCANFLISGIILIARIAINNFWDNGPWRKWAFLIWPKCHIYAPFNIVWKSALYVSFHFWIQINVRIQNFRENSSNPDSGYQISNHLYNNKCFVTGVIGYGWTNAGVR